MELLSVLLVAGLAFKSWLLPTPRAQAQATPEDDALLNTAELIHITSKSESMK